MKENGELSDDQDQVFEWLLEYLEEHDEEPTRRELHQWLAVEKANSRAQLEGPNLVKPRITELKDEHDLVEEKDKRECDVTGNQARPVAPKEYQSSLSSEDDGEESETVEVDGEEYVFEPEKNPVVNEEESDSRENDDSEEKSDCGDQKILFKDGEVVK